MGVLQYCIQVDAPHARYSTTHRPPPVTLKSSTALYYDTMLTTTSSIQLVWLGGREKLSHTTLSRFSTVAPSKAPTKRREEMRREGRVGGRGLGMEVAATASSASAADAADADRSRSRRRGKLSGRCGNSGSRLSAHAAGAEAESEGEVGGETN